MWLIVRRPSDPPISLTHPAAARLPPGAHGGSYLGELRDLLAHLAVHLVVVQLLLDVGELCRSPVDGGARPGGLSGRLTGARSHSGSTPPFTPPGELPAPGRTQRRSCHSSEEKSHRESRQLFFTRACHSSVRGDSPARSSSGSLENIWVGGALLVRSGGCPPSPAVHPVLAEVTRWESIGDALAPTDPSPLLTDG